MKFRLNPLSTALLLAGFMPFAVQAVNAPVIADSYINSPAPTSNFGTSASLRINNSAKTLLRFDLSELPNTTIAADVAKATLIFWVNTVTSAGALQVIPLTSAWTESGVTSSTAPTQSATIKTGITTAVSASGYYVLVDITNQVQDWIAAPASNFGLAIEPDAGAAGTFVMIDSKENTTTSHPAFLDIILTGTGAAGPTGATGATGANGANGAVGATGPTGANGTNGAAGATGATGANGTNGAAGATGATGANGTNGATGATGPAGANGTNGTNGAAGATGPAGANGTNGSNGAIGPTGPAGSNGTNGVGVPIGGTANQVLSKINSTDYNTQWVTPSSGGTSIQYLSNFTALQLYSTAGALDFDLFLPMVDGQGGPSPAQALAQYAMPLACTVSALRVKLSTAGNIKDGRVITLYKNGSATALSCTLASGACTDLTHSVSVVIGDLMNYKIPFATGQSGSANDGAITITSVCQ